MRGMLAKIAGSLSSVPGVFATRATFQLAPSPSFWLYRDPITWLFGVTTNCRRNAEFVPKPAPSIRRLSSLQTPYTKRFVMPVLMFPVGIIMLNTSRCPAVHALTPLLPSTSEDRMTQFGGTTIVGSSWGVGAPWGGGGT